MIKGEEPIGCSSPFWGLQSSVYHPDSLRIVAAQGYVADCRTAVGVGQLIEHDDSVVAFLLFGFAEI